MIKAIIVDDEERACTMLEALINKYIPEITELQIVNSATDAIEKLKTFQPDLMFLDIQMPFLNGFDLLNKLEAIDFNIIFTTAFNQYAIKAIRFSALDYLLKPIDVIELQNAVQRHLQKKQALSSTNLQYQNLVKNLSATTKEQFSLAINGAHGMQFLSLKEIIRLEGDRNYTNFILTEGRSILSAKTMKEYEEILNDKGFIRIHKSHMINVMYAKSISADGNLLMTDNSEVEISRRRYPEVLKLLPSGMS